VVQLKPRFLASRLQSKPLRCRIRAASAEGSESSCQECGCEVQCWGQWVQDAPPPHPPRESCSPGPCLPRSRAAAHLCLQHPQVKDVEVAGEGGGKGQKGAQSWWGQLLLGHRHDQDLSVEVHGGDVAQQGGEADRAAVLHLPKSTELSAGQGSGRARQSWTGTTGPPAPCGLSSSARGTGICQHPSSEGGCRPGSLHGPRRGNGQTAGLLRGLARLGASS